MTEIFCFTPSNADHTLVDGYIVSFYDTELDNPYTAENTDKKINECIDVLNLDKYKLRDDERWIRFSYDSIRNGKPKRI